jgi:hypothetical protein
MKTWKNWFPLFQHVCFLLLNLCLFIVPQYSPVESNNELHLEIMCLMICLKLCSSSKVWVSMFRWLLTFNLEVQLVRIMKGEYLVLAWTPHLYPIKTLSNWQSQVFMFLGRIDITIIPCLNGFNHSFSHFIAMQPLWCNILVLDAINFA